MDTKVKQSRKSNRKSLPQVADSTSQRMFFDEDGFEALEYTEIKQENICDNLKSLSEASKNSS